MKSAEKRVDLATIRRTYQPDLPALLKNLAQCHLEPFETDRPIPEIAQAFPHIASFKGQRVKPGKGSVSSPLRIGVVFSGGQAPGGHNVVAALFDGLKELNSGSTLLGFLNGPGGLVKGIFEELTLEKIAAFRNQGGFDLLGSGRTKIETAEQKNALLSVVQKEKLDGIVIIGGDDSNTNAALLSEFFISKDVPCQVIGVPKTIDGDLRNPYVEISFGFDTACRIYSEMIGNIGRDALSAKKYTHFIRLMGRSASHVALECALQTQPNLTLISEEIAAKGITLSQITTEIADLIEKRDAAGKSYGLILIPEGLIEFIAEFKPLMKELNAQTKTLSASSQKTFDSLPRSIQEQLQLDRDPHGNVQVSKINTEQLLIDSVTHELKRRGFKGAFSPQGHFLGYEGRAGLPTNFDACYCAALGKTAALLLAHKQTAMMAAVTGLTKKPSDWQPVGIPLAPLMRFEERKGEMRAVIEKALVDLKGPLFQEFAKKRPIWQFEDHYLTPGPIQFFGDPRVTDCPPLTLRSDP